MRVLTSSICLSFLLSSACTIPRPAPTLTPAFAPPFALAPGDAMLAGAGDIARCGPGLANAQRTGDLLRALPAATIFAAGDDAYPDGTAEEFSRCYDAAWGSFKSRTRPAPGNHDHHTTDLAGYLGYFGTQAPAPHYSFDLEQWHIVSLDSGLSGSAASFTQEAAWLEDDLTQSSKPCIAAFWHHPRYSSGIHNNNAGATAVWRVLLRHHADVVLNGHDHDYERFDPQDENGHASADGIRQFVVGTGGDELRPFAWHRPNSAVRISGSFGVLVLALHSTSYEWTFLGTDGMILDRSSTAVSCHVK